MYEVQAIARPMGQPSHHEWVAAKTNDFEKATAEAGRLFDDERSRNNYCKIVVVDTNKPLEGSDVLWHWGTFEIEHPSKEQLIYEQLQLLFRNRVKGDHGARTAKAGTSR